MFCYAVLQQLDYFISTRTKRKKPSPAHQQFVYLLVDFVNLFLRGAVPGITI